MTSEEMRLMEEKIETLFRTYYRNLVQYAEIILARSPCPTDPDRGEELVQETFALACSKWETFRTSPNPVGWLYLTVNYLALNAMRADYRWCSHVVQDQDAYFVQDQKTSPPGAALELEGLISPQDMALLRQLYLGGFTYKEMAQDIGVSRSAFAKRVSRIKKRFRTKYLEIENFFVEDREQPLPIGHNNSRGGSHR